MRRHELLSFPVVPDHRGNLTFVEGNAHIPFEIKRVFYLYDVPGGESRAGHALKDVEQVIIATTARSNDGALAVAPAPFGSRPTTAPGNSSTSLPSVAPSFTTACG